MARVSPAILIAGIAAAIVLLFLIANPHWIILVLIILLSSIVYENQLPLLPIPMGSLHITDVILILALLLVCVQPVMDRRKHLYRTPLNICLLAFYGAVLLSTCLAIAYGRIDFTTAMRYLRLFSYYLLFFVVTNCVQDKKRLSVVVYGMYAIAAVVVLAMVLQSQLGDSVNILPGRVEKAATLGEQYDTFRILPPGEMLVYASFIICMAVTCIDNSTKIWRSAHFYLCAWLGIGVLLTYNRSYWITIVVLWTILVLRLKGAERRRTIACMGIWIICFIGLFSCYALLSRGASQTLKAVAARVTSLSYSSGLSRDESLSFRVVESTYAVRAIMKHPILGNGIGVTYRPSTWELNDSTFYIHNAYLWILLQTGLVGLATFLCFWGSFLIRGFHRISRIGNPFDKGLGTGLWLSSLGATAVAFVSPVFMQWYSVVVFAVVIGLNEVICGRDSRPYSTGMYAGRLSY